MRKETYKCGGQYTVTISVPSEDAAGVKEFDTLAKKEGACVAKATDYVVYHSTLSDIRAKVIELVEKAHEIAQGEIDTGKKDSDGKPITKDEGFETFLNRVAATKKLPGLTPFADIFAKVSAGGSDEVPFDPSTEARSGKPPKLPTRYVEGMKEVIASKKVNAFANKYKKITGKDLVYDKALEGDALVQALGWLAREMILIEERQKGSDAFTGAA